MILCVKSFIFNLRHFYQMQVSSAAGDNKVLFALLNWAVIIAIIEYTDGIISVNRNRYKGDKMSITINIYYSGKNGNAAAFANEMESSGIADRIRAEEGNLRYDYFIPLGDEETVLLIDSWKNREALDIHHASAMMAEIAALREKYDLHMRVERFVSDDREDDEKFIRK